MPGQQKRDFRPCPILPAFFAGRVGNRQPQPAFLSPAQKSGAPHLDFEMWESTPPNPPLSIQRKQSVPLGPSLSGTGERKNIPVNAANPANSAALAATGLPSVRV